MPRPNLYLDIDGTVLVSRHTTGPEVPTPGCMGQVLAQNASAFFDYVVPGRKVFWLSQWATPKSRGQIDNWLLPILPATAAAIGVAPWDGQNKATGLPSDKIHPWIWLDDDAYHLAPRTPEYRTLASPDVGVIEVRGGQWDVRTIPFPLPTGFFVHLEGTQANLQVALAIIQFLDQLLGQ